MNQEVESLVGFFVNLLSYILNDFEINDEPPQYNKSYLKIIQKYFVFLMKMGYLKLSYSSFLKERIT